MKEHLEKLKEPINDRHSDWSRCCDVTTPVVADLVQKCMLQESNFRRPVDFIIEKWDELRKNAEKWFNFHPAEFPEVPPPPVHPQAQETQPDSSAKHGAPLSKDPNMKSFDNDRFHTEVPSSTENRPEKGKSKRKRVPPPSWPLEEAEEWLQDRDTVAGSRQELDPTCCEELRGRDHVCSTNRNILRSLLTRSSISSLTTRYP